MTLWIESDGDYQAFAAGRRWSVFQNSKGRWVIRWTVLPTNGESVGQIGSTGLLVTMGKEPRMAWFKSAEAAKQATEDYIEMQEHRDG